MLKKATLIFSFFHLSDAFSIIKEGTSAKSMFPLVKPQHISRSVHHMARQTNDEFWEAQRRMAGEMSDALNQEENKVKQKNRELYQKQVFGLVSETFYFSVLIFCLVWILSPNPFTGVSYLLGASLGTAYTYGLGKYVETLGGSAYDAADVKGSGVGSARFAFLIALFIFVGKFRSAGLQEIPAIMGFFTYQLSTLSQGLKDAFDADDLY